MSLVLRAAPVVLHIRYTYAQVHAWRSWCASMSPSICRAYGEGTCKSERGQCGQTRVARSPSVHLSKARRRVELCEVAYVDHSVGILPLALMPHMRPCAACAKRHTSCLLVLGHLLLASHLVVLVL